MPCPISHRHSRSSRTLTSIPDRCLPEVGRYQVTEALEALESRLAFAPSLAPLPALDRLQARVSVHVECTEAGLDAILLPSPSPMIGIMIVSLQERHAVYRRAGHETNVTRSSCTRRAVVGAKCPARGGDETAPIRHFGMALDGQVVSPGHQGLRSPLTVPAGHAKTCWPANAGQGGTGGGGGGGGSGERNGQDGS